MSGSVQSDECDVYLCSTAIQQGELINAASGAVSFFASASRPVCGDSWNKHWLLVFDYGDDEVLICDADRDQAGDLTGRRYWKKRMAFVETYPKKRYLGRHHAPEWLLEKLLKKMCDRGRYHLTSNNCQTWAIGLLRELGIKPPEEEHHAEKVVNEVILPGMAIGGAILVGATVLVALISGGARRKNRD